MEEEEGFPPIGDDQPVNVFSSSSTQWSVSCVTEHAVVHR